MQDYFKETYGRETHFIHYAGQYLSTKEVQQQFAKAIFKKKFRAEHAKMTERLFRKAGLWYTGATDESKMKAQSRTVSAILDAGGFLFGGIMVQ